MPLVWSLAELAANHPVVSLASDSVPDSVITPVAFEPSGRTIAPRLPSLFLKDCSQPSREGVVQ